MKVERLQKLSKDKLIKMIFNKNKEIVLLREELEEPQNVGEIFLSNKTYKVILREVGANNGK